MPPTYIAGFDGTPAASAATRFAIRLAAANSAHVVVATVKPEGLTSWHGAAGEEFARADGSVTSCSVAAGSPVTGLARLALDRDASLVVVGATDPVTSGRGMPRSVAEGLLLHAAGPVAVVPAGWPDAPIKSVALAYGGEDSGDAVSAARDLAGQLELQRLLVIGIYDPGLADSYEWCERQAQEIERIVETMPRRNVAEPWLLTGGVGAALVDACREHVDLLIVGSFARGPARSTLTRSVSRHVVENARCPVLVVPRRAQQRVSTAATYVSAASPARCSSA